MKESDASPIIASRAVPWRSLRAPRVVAEAGAVLAFIAAILASNYALSRFPNVKLFDLMVFVAGYALGFRRGAAVAIGAWAVYGNFNPFGPTTLPLLAVVAASETVYAAAGALLRKLAPPSRLKAAPGLHSLKFVAAALACTLLYDAATNIYTGIHWATLSGSTSYLRWMATALFNPGALFFALAHTSSNAIFFGAFGPILAKGVDKLRGGSRP